MSERVATELRKLAESWPHHRDRLWMEQPIGSGYWKLLVDSGCIECHRCELMEFVRRNQP